jgi:acyl-CoA synthetase (AMP-forming)/AMP-acid ligase II
MDVWVAALDDPSTRLRDGACGEIVIAGPQVAAGYVTAAAPGPAGGRRGPFLCLPGGRRGYRTGDLGYVDPADGSLFCAGRVDRQVKLRGYRIELEEIEAHLRALPGVTDAAVLTVDRDGRPDHLVAFVVGPTARGRALTAYVREGLAAHLPDYALPRLAHSLPSLPLTAHGKLDRRALRETAG